MLVEGECSHHCATDNPALSLFKSNVILGDPAAVSRDGTKKPQAKSGPVRVDQEANL